jgi:hypothetical protein
MKEKWVCDSSPEEVTLEPTPVFTLAAFPADIPEHNLDSIRPEHNLDSIRPEHILDSTRHHWVWVTLHLDTPKFHTLWGDL